MKHSIRQPHLQQYFFVACCVPIMVYLLLAENPYVLPAKVQMQIG